MPKSEEYDLEILIRYLEKSLADQFRKELRLENNKKNNVKIVLFNSLKKKHLKKIIF